MLKTLNFALSILKMFTKDKPEWGGRELSHHLNVNYTKVYRVLETLVNNNFLFKNPETKKYTLGFAVWELGVILYEGMDSKELIHPKLTELYEQTGESVFLTILDKDEAITLDAVEPEHKVKFSVTIGSRVPLYAGASYRSILAYMSESFQSSILTPEYLKKHTPNSMVNPDEIRAELANIRSRGYAISQGEYTEDVIAIAVPLFDDRGIIGSLTVSGPTYRFSEKKIAHCISELQESKIEVEDVIKRYNLSLSHT